MFREQREKGLRGRGPKSRELLAENGGFEPTHLENVWPASL